MTIARLRLPQRPFGFCFLSLIAGLAFLSAQSSMAQDWKPMANAAPSSIQLMVQMTDGTLLVQSFDGQTWMKLTPDAYGSYVNGTWTTVAPARLPAIYFASQVLPDGRFWYVGGEYTGPGLLPNWGNRGEIYDPVANKWTPIAPFPAQTAACPYVSYVAGNQTAGSTRISHIYPQTTGIQKGWAVFGQGIPAGATVLSTEENSIRISAAATQTLAGNDLFFNNYFQLSACFGDDPSILLPGGKILTGFLTANSTWIYDVASNSWSATGNKTYNDPSDEEGWAKLPNGKVLTYDLFKSIDPLEDGSNLANGMYAEEYNPNTASWSGISPSDGSARGSIPQLSSTQVGYELGPILRLQDGRVLAIGATQHTALYNPSTNTWAAGPDIRGTLSNSANPPASAPFGADDAPAAELPNGHVIFAADAGPSPVALSGNITSGSAVITGLSSTALLQVYWGVSGNGIPGGAYILSVDSQNQVTLNQPAAATIARDALNFGGVFSNPTQLFDFNPSTSKISPLSPPIPDGNLPYEGAFPTRMLTLPTGQVMFTDGGPQPWIYTPAGSARAELRPRIEDVDYTGRGVFKLTGTKLNGQSAGAAYGDDDQMDSNYPLVRFTATDGSGHVFYGKTTNWSSTSVAGGNARQTVNFTLNAAMKPGNYSMEVIGAGIASAPRALTITQAEISRH